MDTNPSPPEPQPKEIYAVFVGEINQATVQRIAHNLAVISQQQGGVKMLHLLFQSTGGYIGDGILLYNLFRTAPFPISLYNGGSVQSMATVCFLAAPHRIANEHATFMLHAVSGGAMPQSSHKMANTLATLKIDDARVESILKRHLKIDSSQWPNLRNHELWFTAQDALSSGIITKVGCFSAPRGAHVWSFMM